MRVLRFVASSTRLAAVHSVSSDVEALSNISMMLVPNLVSTRILQLQERPFVAGKRGSGQSEAFIAMLDKCASSFLGLHGQQRT